MLTGFVGVCCLTVASARDMVRSLPDAQREAVARHYLIGDDIATIAVALERTPAAVAGLLHRGLKRLREHVVSAAADLEL